MISIAQIRGARGLLGWSQTKLAFEARVSIATIKRLEAQGTIKVSNDTREAARNALEAAGVDFIDENGGGPGVATEETDNRVMRKRMREAVAIRAQKEQGTKRSIGGVA